MLRVVCPLTSGLSLNRVRRIFLALWMALALVVGQHALALHDLAHATDPIHKQDSTPGKNTCDKCFACAQLSGAVGASIPEVPLVEAQPHLSLDPSYRAIAGAPRLAFRSRAPPAIA